MELRVDPNSGLLTCGPDSFRCAIGRSGVRSDKREGDGATPIGNFALRRLFYRADRIERPNSGLETQALDPAFGWCDDQARPEYNRFVRLPYAGRHERLWRDDSLYDIVAVIGYNDTPVRPGAGSAIFLHVAAPDYAPTEGCVALAEEDLMTVLAACDAASTIRILRQR